MSSADVGVAGAWRCQLACQALLLPLRDSQCFHKQELSKPCSEGPLWLSKCFSWMCSSTPLNSQPSEWAFLGRGAGTNIWMGHRVGVWRWRARPLAQGCCQLAWDRVRQCGLVGRARLWALNSSDRPRVWTPALPFTACPGACACDSRPQLLCL